ncbi:MAG: DMT family transporter [Rhizobiaceae bacterium]|nr:DMT family transporter [Rhizobiaceae bacterium]
MSSSDSQHAKGLLVTAFGGLVLTFDIPLIRLAQGETWSVMLVRSGATFLAAVVIWAIWRSFSRNAPSLAPGWTGVAVALLYGVTSILFMMAIYRTSTANLAFILAFNSVFAAILSWVFLRERPRNVTLVAMAIMLVGVLIIVGDGIGGGSFVGDMLALGSAFTAASAITLTRASGQDMGLTALSGVLLPAVVAAFFVAGNGYRIDVPWWIIFNGAIVMPLAFYCLATGPRWISAPEVAMFYLLETVLAPVWVWMIFHESPTRNALIGGLILIVTLIAHATWQLWDARRRSAGATGPVA